MRLTFFVLILVLSGCGGGNGKSSSPPPQQPEKVVAEVVLNAVDEVLEEGDQFQLNAIARDENGQTIVGKVTTWRSLNTDVVTVSDSGLVTAHASGSTSIEAKIDGVTAICDFEVIGTYAYQLMYNKTQFAVLSNLYSLDIGDSQADPQLMLEQTEFSYVSHASASPNGEMVAFVVREESGSATLSNIYIANRDGSNARRLTFNNLRNTDPAWSPGI